MSSAVPTRMTPEVVSTVARLIPTASLTDNLLVEAAPDRARVPVELSAVPVRVAEAALDVIAPFEVVSTVNTLRDELFKICNLVALFAPVSARVPVELTTVPVSPNVKAELVIALLVVSMINIGVVSTADTENLDVEFVPLI